MHGFEVSVKRLDKLRKKYRDEGWKFTGGEALRKPKKRKLSEDGNRKMLEELVGTNARRLSKKMKFEAADGGRDVKVSRELIRRSAKEEKLELSIPKVIRIREHTDHHLQQRMAFCRWWLKLSPTEQHRTWFSDEMSFTIQLQPNKKNDVIYCKKGEQSKTNTVRAHKGDTHAIFSMWWVVNYHGVVCVQLYASMMGVELFHQFLREHLKPRIKDHTRSRLRLEHFYHDHVTNSSNLYEPEVMNDLILLWFQARIHCATLCRYSEWRFVCFCPT